MTLRQFIALHKIHFKYSETDRNPHMGDDVWSRTARHWICTLRVGRQSMRVHFSQGQAITDDPTLADVLNSLGSDANSYLDARSFEEWASDLGYDTDSRKAEKTYNAIAAQVGELTRLLGEQSVRWLAYDVERP